MAARASEAPHHRVKPAKQESQPVASEETEGFRNIRGRHRPSFPLEPITELPRSALHPGVVHDAVQRCSEPVLGQSGASDGRRRNARKKTPCGAAMVARTVSSLRRRRRLLHRGRPHPCNRTTRVPARRAAPVMGSGMACPARSSSTDLEIQHADDPETGEVHSAVSLTGEDRGLGGGCGSPAAVPDPRIEQTRERSPVAIILRDESRSV